MCSCLPPSGTIRSLRPRLAAAESAHILLEGNLRPTKPNCQMLLSQMNSSTHQQPDRALPTFRRGSVLRRTFVSQRNVLKRKKKQEKKKVCAELAACVENQHLPRKKKEKKRKIERTKADELGPLRAPTLLPTHLPLTAGCSKCADKMQSPRSRALFVVQDSSNKNGGSFPGLLLPLPWISRSLLVVPLGRLGAGPAALPLPERPVRAHCHTRALGLLEGHPWPRASSCQPGGRVGCCSGGAAALVRLCSLLVLCPHHRRGHFRLLAWLVQGSGKMEATGKFKLFLFSFSSLC